MSFCQHCWSAHSISVSLSQPTVQSLHPIKWRAALATFSHYDLKGAIAFRVLGSPRHSYLQFKRFLISLRCSVTVNYPDLDGNQGRDHYDVVWQLVPSPDDSREEWFLNDNAMPDWDPVGVTLLMLLNGWREGGGQFYDDKVVNVRILRWGKLSHSSLSIIPVTLLVVL